MGEFYNKYKRLFTEPPIDHHPSADFYLPYNYKSPNATNLNRYLELDRVEKRQEPATNKMNRLDRSPALDEVPFILFSFNVISYQDSRQSQMHPSN